MTWVSRVAARPRNRAKVSGVPPEMMGSSAIIRKGVMPLSGLAMAPDRGCTKASSSTMPQVTPESTMTLKFSRALPSTLMAAMTVTSRMTMPVLPMPLRKRVRKKSLGMKLGASSRMTSRNRKARMIFCTRERTRLPSLSSLLTSRWTSLPMSGRKMYLPMTMKSSEHTAQMSRAMSMYLA